MDRCLIVEEALHIERTHWLGFTTQRITATRGVYFCERAWPDALNRFERWWALPVQFILFFFGLANGGVPLGRIGPGTYYVLAALLVGKPLGILLFTLGARFAGARLPEGLRVADLLVLGSVASIGFTVSLFFATAAFPDGAALAQTKMGALFSLVAIPIAFGLARMMGIRRA
jgi:Na+:H+ antiporter, NhaA family